MKSYVYRIGHQKYVHMQLWNMQKKLPMKE